MSKRARQEKCSNNAAAARAAALAARSHETIRKEVKRQHLMVQEAMFQKVMHQQKRRQQATEALVSEMARDAAAAARQQDVREAAAHIEAMSLLRRQAADAALLLRQAADAAQLRTLGIHYHLQRKHDSPMIGQVNDIL
jgi:hypothetical protein